MNRAWVYWMVLKNFPLDLSIFQIIPGFWKKRSGITVLGKIHSEILVSFILRKEIEFYN